MEPEYAVGDILISKEKDPSEIKVGDNIVYLGAEGGYAGKIITHSVIKIEQNEKGEYLFHTMGKANTVEDPIVNEDQLHGVVFHNNQVLAFICKILTNRYGLFFVVVIPITIYTFVGFIKAQGEKIEHEKELERERKRKMEEKRKRRKIKVVELDEDDEMIEGEIIEEVVKTPKKSASKTTSSKKKAEEPVEEPVKTKKASNTTKAPKTASKTSDTEKKKTSAKKKAKEE